MSKFVPLILCISFSLISKAFATLVRMTNGEAQESTMVVLEQILSSDGCEATMRAHDWKDMFCDVLIPLLEEEVKPSESCETQNEEAIGRTKLRGVMTLSKLFLLQHMRISKRFVIGITIPFWIIRGVYLIGELVFFSVVVWYCSVFLPLCIV